MTTANEILDLLRSDILSHGFFAQCVADGGGEAPLDSRVSELLQELLSSGEVEIGTARQARPDYVEFIAWTGSVRERVRRATDEVSVAADPDKAFAYWLCLRENVDRYEP